jgi:nicotinate phosphoribosyltransferase
MVYKLAEYAGSGRLKLSAGKAVLPGSKQVFRVEEDGAAVRDVIARAEESGPGRPLLRLVMRGGRRVEAGAGAEAGRHPEHDTGDSLDEARRHAALELGKLPAHLRSLAPADPPYPVKVSEALARLQHTIAGRVDSNAEVRS